ncbi:enoyl-CoA hydratase-related protein [Microbacterium sp. CPCC 204701]|uniref:enoyl-CoA hydratase-related protein n=1 Tax=Microbacterium sp. CPCC 204701 TaxID=2493084 RepID=UPI000FD89A68|nr:enoyl-CoA hydratase-related protein [Microbacterium sp. CPCC 204701]
MRTYEQILVDRVGTDGRVARITLNNPEKLNILSPQMVAELMDALRVLESDMTARVIILRGAGRAFSAGWDLGNPNVGNEDPAYTGGAYPIFDGDGRPLAMNFANGLKRGAEAQLYMWSMAKVTIAQVHGFCIAGGLEWAAMADLATASKDCIIGHPGSRGLGVARNAALLPLVTSWRKAKELLLTGDSVSGEQAAELGIVNYAWDEEELDSRTIALADRVANMSADHLAVTKAAANRFVENMGVRSSIASATELDALGQNTVANHAWTDKLRNEGLKAALEWRDKPYGDYGFRPR